MGNYINELENEIERLTNINRARESKLREWAARADAYDPDISTMIKMITEELLIEDHG